MSCSVCCCVYSRWLYELILEQVLYVAGVFTCFITYAFTCPFLCGEDVVCVPHFAKLCGAAFSPQKCASKGWRGTLAPGQPCQGVANCAIVLVGSCDGE